MPTYEVSKNCCCLLRRSAVPAVTNSWNLGRRIHLILFNGPAHDKYTFVELLSLAYWRSDIKTSQSCVCTGPLTRQGLISSFRSTVLYCTVPRPRRRRPFSPSTGTGPPLIRTVSSGTRYSAYLLLLLDSIHTEHSLTHSSTLIWPP